MEKQNLRIGQMYWLNYFGEKYPCFLKEIHENYVIVECHDVEVDKELTTKDAMYIDDTIDVIEVKFSDLEPYVYKAKK